MDKTKCVSVKHCEHATCCYCKEFDTLCASLLAQGYPQYAVDALIAEGKR